MNSPHQRRRRTVVLGFLTGVAALLGALPAEASPPTPLTTTSSANDRIARVLPVRLQDPVLGRDVAVDVFDLATDRHVFTRRSTAPYRVASNTKLVTAATALETMGPSRTFPTTVVLGRGGHVYLVGGGDPLLSSATLRSLAKKTAAALRARGQTRVSVLLDDTLFAPWTFPSGFANRCSANHLTRGYCITPVRALTVDRRSGDDNARDAARSFAQALNSAAGVAASYRGRAQAPRTRLGVGGPTGAADPIQLARYAGHRLDEIIQAMLSVSDDEIAETLFRHVALATGRPASMAGGRAAQRAVLRSLGVPLEGVITSSGSGRSSIDRFSARALVRLLAVAVDGKHPRMAALRDGTAFTGRLPLMMRAGIDGTLGTAYGRYSTRPSSCARGKVYAKTGGLADAIALSGYAKGSDGRWKVFSVLVNSRPKAYSPLATRQHVDRIAASVTGCY